MKTKSLLILLLILIIATLSGCGSGTDSSDSGYSKITAKEAKEMMDNDSFVTILDVRTEEEYKTGHIEGAILIPDTGTFPVGTSNNSLKCIGAASGMIPTLSDRMIRTIL